MQGEVGRSRRGGAKQGEVGRKRGGFARGNGEKEKGGLCKGKWRGGEVEGLSKGK